MVFNFNEGYKRNNFINFLRTNLFRDKFKQETNKDLPPKRKTAFFYEDKIFQLGTVQLGDEEIAVIEINQKSHNDPRVTLTQDAFKLMADYGIDNAIVALYVDEKSSWRFSLLTTKYENFKKTTSNPKRFSFILGPNEKIRTVNQQLIKKGEIKDFEDLVSRFDVEVVRKEFFETYLELFVRLYKEILKDKEFSNLLTSQNVDLVSFTKNLLGKIIFLYFIQQKGWLGLGKKSSLKYGEGNKDFMRVMWNNFKKQGESMCTHEKRGYFYNDYLEWLFYAGLNVDRRNNDDRFEQLQMKLPYLNGGLFKEEYKDWQINIAKINNDIFSNIEKKGDDADGILDIFDRYNFTIDEDSLYDTDIAVDPEMLGRIFEKMISISSDNIQDVLDIYDKKKTNAKFDFGKDLNKKLGAFYTPREIVHYMTRESLIAYLSNKTYLSENNIRVLFDLKEKFLLKNDIENANYPADIISEIKNNIIDIDTALQNVKILDPAVGSGAFPMGLLHEISSMRYYIYGAFIDKFGDKAKEYMIFNEDKNKDTISLYKIKKDIILNNIHGVDIDPGAIDIAKLRFRLSLVVDEQEPEPLPNFEFKFVCANSLIPLEECTEEEDEFSRNNTPKLETLKDYKRKFFNANNNEEKEKYKNYIRNYTKRKQLRLGEKLTTRQKQIEEFGSNFDNPKHSHTFFDPSLMLSERKGFDIVIGNPPYFLVKPGEYLNQLKSRFIYSDSGKTNIYRLFIEFAINFCLKDNGIMSYINPNDYLTSKQGSGIRRLIINNCKIKEIIEYTEQDRVFENVTQAVTTILLMRGFMNNNSFKLKTAKHGLQILEQDEIKNDKDFLIIKKNSVIKKMELLEKKLGDFVDGFQGEINLTTKKNWYSETKKAGTLPMIRGNNIFKFYYSSPIEYCSLKANDRPHYKQSRIVNQQISNQSQKFRTKSAYLDAGFLCGNSTNYFFIKEGIDKSLLCFLGIFNSKVFNYYFNYFSCTNHLTVSELQIIPVPEISSEDSIKIEQIVNSILQKKQENLNIDTSSLESQLDCIVYKIYGLTDEEIQIVEDSLK